MMNKKNSFDFVRDAMSYDEFERLTRQAYAERDAALGRALKHLALAVAEVYGRLIGVIEEALQLRALAMLEDRQLAALGHDRLNLPAFVYGWKTSEPEVVCIDVPERPARPVRLAA